MYKVVVLLSTYNGEKYLEQQIDSILAQTERDLFIVARDDGSTDRTTEILDSYAAAGRLRWYTGENLGPEKSFLNLLQNSDEAAYYAFCDQDDYWHPDKIEAALHMLEAQAQEQPLLYFGKKRLVDGNLQPLEREDVYVRTVSYGCALINGVAFGCTMVFNHAVRALFEDFTPQAKYMHDVLLYRTVAAVGKVLYDPAPHMDYRQHGGNVVGANKSGFQKWSNRFRNLFKRGEDHSRSACAKDILNAFGNRMSQEDRKLTEQLAYCHESIKKRLGLFCNPRLTAQKKSDMLSWRIFILLGWI